MFTVLNSGMKEPSETYLVVILSLIHVVVLTNKASLPSHIKRWKKDNKQFRSYFL